WALRELLDEHAILRKKPGVMQPDAVPQPLANLRPIRAAELETLQRVGTCCFLVACADIDAGEILRALGRLELCEMHYIDGRLAAGDKTLQCLRKRSFRVSELQRHRPLLGRDCHC